MPKTTAEHMHTEFRFADGNAAVLQLREVWNNYRIVGVDHEGNPFRTSIGLWNRLRPATEDDFRKFARDAEIHAGTVIISREPEFPEQVVWQQGRTLGIAPDEATAYADAAAMCREVE